MKKLLAILFFTLPVVWATSQNELVVVDHELTITGTSTLKNWTMQVEQIDVHGQAIYEGDQLTGFRNVAVAVNVKE